MRALQGGACCRHGRPLPHEAVRRRIHACLGRRGAPTWKASQPRTEQGLPARRAALPPQPLPGVHCRQRLWPTWKDSQCRTSSSSNSGAMAKSFR